jgi:hypothetical protein
MVGHDSLRPGNSVKPPSGASDKVTKGADAITDALGKSGAVVAETIIALREETKKETGAIRAIVVEAKGKATEAAASIEAMKTAAAEKQEAAERITAAAERCETFAKEAGRNSGEALEKANAALEALEQVAITAGENVYTGADALRFMIEMVTTVPDLVNSAVAANLSIEVDQIDAGSGGTVKATKTGADALAHILETAQTAMSVAGQSNAAVVNAERAAATAAGDAVAGFTEDALEIVAESKMDMMAGLTELSEKIGEAEARFAKVIEVVDMKFQLLLGFLRGAGVTVDEGAADLIDASSYSVKTGDD